MRSLLVLVVALLASCAQLTAAAASGRVGYYEGNQDMDFVHGTKDARGGNYGFTVTFAPLDYYRMQLEAEAMARAIVETQYRRAMGVDSSQVAPDPPPTK